MDTVAALKEVVHVQTTDFKGAMCLDSFQVDALAVAVCIMLGEVLEGTSARVGRPRTPRRQPLDFATFSKCPGVAAEGTPGEPFPDRAAVSYDWPRRTSQCPACGSQLRTDPPSYSLRIWHQTGDLERSHRPTAALLRSGFETSCQTLAKV